MKAHIAVIGIDGNVFLVKGSAWADREWSSSILGPNQAGWDWFSLHLGDDEKLMLFRVRNKGSNEYYSGTLVKKDKTIIHLKHDEIMMTHMYGSGVFHWKTEKGDDLEYWKDLISKINHRRSNRSVQIF